MHKKLIVIFIGLIMLHWGGIAGAKELKTVSQPLKVRQSGLSKASDKKSMTDEYVLVMSKNEDVCHYMLNLYNNDLKKYGQVRYKLHKEFNWIKWEDKGIRLRPVSEPTYVMGISARIALFDINNDSKDEVVLYSPSMLANQPIESYDVFPYDILTILNENKITDGEAFFSKRMAHFSSSDGIPVNVYEISEENIKKLPVEMQSSITYIKTRGDKNEYYVGWDHKIDFVKLKDCFYIAFDGYPSIGPKQNYEEVGHYSILSEYQQDNTLRHQCMYLIKESKQNRRVPGFDDRPSRPMPRYLEKDKPAQRREK